MQQKIRFQIEGMTCQACASRIEKVLNKKDFVESAGVNFASEEAQVVFDDSKTSVADIAKIIEKTGYGAKEKRKIHCRNPKQNTISAGGCGCCSPSTSRSLSAWRG